MSALDDNEVSHSEEELSEEEAPVSSKRKKAAASDDDYEEEEDLKPAKKGRGRKKKGGDEDDDDWGGAKKKKPAKKSGGGGGRGKQSAFTKSFKLSEELADVVGADVMPRHEVVKKLWAVIKERNLQDPKNKQFAICDDQLMKVIGVKRFRTFGMMKHLKDHFLEAA